MSALASYCCACDAPTGACNHDGPRYLDPVVYEPAATGWAVPDGPERERWDNPPEIVKGISPHPPGFEPGSKPASLPDLLKRLSYGLYVRQQAEEELAICYQHDPVRTSRLAEDVIAAVKTGRIKNPSGLLESMLQAEMKRYGL